MNIDPTGTGDGMFSFSPQITWDNLHNVARFWGGCHGTGGGPEHLYLGTYTDSTNSWPSVPVNAAEVVNTITHAYFSATIDQQTGDVYTSEPFWDLSHVWKYSWATQSWSNPLPSSSIWGAHCAALTVVYHPGLYGTHGGLVLGSNSGIWTIDLRATTPAWTLILDRTQQVNAMPDFPAGIYDYKTQCVYVGGSTGFWQIAASAGAGTPVQVTAPTISPQGGQRIVTSSGNPSNNMLVMDQSGNAVEFNGSTWSSFTTNAPAGLLSTTNNWYAAGAVPAYGVIIFPRGELSPTPKTSLTMYVWKR